MYVRAEYDISGQISGQISSHCPCRNSYLDAVHISPYSR